jgi:hypothetical protein
VDEPTYNRSRHGHQIATRASVQCAKQGSNKYSATHQRWMDKKPARKKTSTYRMAGLGSMLAVSLLTGVGTAYH